MSTTVPDKKGPWVPEEDEILRRYKNAQIEKTTKDSKPEQGGWASIAAHIPGRCAKQCRERWEQNLKPVLKKGEITEQEAVFIVGFVESSGKKWAEMARQLESRSDNNVKNWYNGMIQKTKAKYEGRALNYVEEHFFNLHRKRASEASSPTPQQQQQPQYGQQQYLYHHGTPGAYGLPQAPGPHHQGTLYAQPGSVLSQPAPAYGTFTQQSTYTQENHVMMAAHLGSRELPLPVCREHEYYNGPPTPSLSRGHTPTSSHGSPQTPASSTYPGYFHNPVPSSAGAQLQADTTPRYSRNPFPSTMQLPLPSVPTLQHPVRLAPVQVADNRGDPMSVDEPEPKRYNPMRLNSIIN